MTTRAVLCTDIACGVKKAAWTDAFTANADVGAAASFPRYPDKSVQLTGGFDGNTVVIEGSNDGGTTYATLHDEAGVALSFTAVGIHAISENVELIRPRMSAGAGVTATVKVYIVGHARS
jgi:hypothetical protein